MQLRLGGVDLSAVIAAVCRDLNVDEKEMASAARGFEVARARAVVSHIATRELSINGSEVARRLHVDRSAVSRAAHRVGKDPDLIATARRILGLLGSETSQH